MKSEELRQKMLKFLDENGIKKGIVAKQTGLSTSILSSWFSGRVNLNKEEIEVIQDYFEKMQQKYSV